MNEKICRLCLQTINNYDCQTVEEPLLIALKLNINITKENVMCIECANGLRVFSNFIPDCSYMEDKILPLSDLDNGVKMEPEAIETPTNLKSFMKTEIKCSFCTHTHGREDLISLKESKENKFLVNMVEQYFWKTYLKNTEELLTCEICLEALQGGLGAILKCLEVEKKINKYIELKGTGAEGRVELKEVQQFMLRPGIKSEIESFSVVKLEDISDQVYEEYTGMAEPKIKHEKEINTELIIKTEVDDFKIKRDDCDTTDIKSEQSDYDGFQEFFIENKNPSEVKMLQCEFCTYHTNRKNCLTRHLLTHKNPSEIKMFKCESCSYAAKRKIHLNTHLLTHKNPSEINMFKCELCAYEAKLKGHLKRHLLVHKSPSEINMFKCELCPYEAKQKSHLERHLLTHKNPSKIKMFKCEFCSHQTKRKDGLTNHLLTHENPLKIKMFKCELCSYQTKWKNGLTSHLLTHKNPREIKMFKCEVCSYETKRKSDLKHHLLTHKNPSEINMFKCELCSYEAKQKCHLRKHLLTHKSPS